MPTLHVPTLGRDTHDPPQFGVRGGEGDRSDEQLLDVVLITTSCRALPRDDLARLLARGLREGGHSVRAVAPENSAWTQRLGAEGVEVVTLGGPCNPLALWRLRQYLWLTSPDIVHCFDTASVALCGRALIGLRQARRVASLWADEAVPSARDRWQADHWLCDSEELARGCWQRGIAPECTSVVPIPEPPTTWSCAHGRSMALPVDDPRVRHILAAYHHQGPPAPRRYAA